MSDWIETPAITVENPGYLGNKLLRFMAVHAAAEHVGNCTISNFDFPEWGKRFPKVDYRRFRKTILVDHVEQFNFGVLRALSRQDPSLHIVVRHYLARQELFLNREVYNEIFPINSQDVPVFGDDHLVVNIRTGDILTGYCHWYPLIPIAFYQDLVRQTGLSPVFVGQLDDCRYVSELMKVFPRATFIPSQGAVRDFDTIRLSANVVAAVSSFSVVAAWLSQAKTVFLPLDGFLNPCHKREIDLVPTDDPRYRFFLFPLNYALPEERALRHHCRLEGTWKEISRERVRQLKTAAPLLPRSQTMPEAYRVPGFDERWYVHEYLDAAIDISDGWYEDAMHHYIDIGRHLGHRPAQNVTPAAAYPNVALGCRAWQSSVSAWSKGRTIYDDAMNAVDGNRNIDYAFHTELEQNPWWTVDFGKVHELKEIVVYNRKGPRQLQRRASPLLFQVSLDGKEWRDLFRTPIGAMFGAEDGGLTPLRYTVQDIVQSRFLRIMVLQERGCLHLAQVEVYALPI